MSTVPTTDPHTPRGRSPGRLRRGVLFVALAVIALPLIGIIYQSAATAIDQMRFPPPGRLITLGEEGDRRLHIHCLGEGSPTIVLDHAGGSSSLQWDLVQPLLAQHTRVCAYDRAGFGWSDVAPGPSDLQRMVADLDKLLAAAGEQAPYLLVGHSYGARVARLFAATYPDKMAGLMLLDPAIDSADPRYPAELHVARAEEERMLAIAGALAPFGLVRLLQPLMNSGSLGDLPPATAAAIHSFDASNKFWQGIRADAQTVDAAPDLQVQDLGDLPLLVISAGQPDDAVRRAWTAANADLARLSTRGRHQGIAAATHMSLVFDGASAEEVAGAIMSLLPAN